MYEHDLSRNARRGNAAAVIVAVLAAIALLWAILYFGFRGPVVKVPPAHVGRIKTPSGFLEELKQPSIFRLPSNWFGMNPTKLILAQTSDNRVVETIHQLFIPADKLNLEFEVIGMFAVSHEDAGIDSIYDRLTPSHDEKNPNVEVITFLQVYETYGQQVLRTCAQEIVAKYAIQHTLEKLDEVSHEIQAEVNKRLATAPLSCKYCGLGAVQPPQVIVDAQVNARKREIEIETANATKLVNLTKADAKYQIGLIEQQIELVEAETQVLSDLVLSDAVSEAYIAQRALRVLDNLAKNPQTTFLVSAKLFHDPASMLGLSSDTVRVLDQNKEERRAKLDEALRKIEEAKKAAIKELHSEKEGAQKKAG